MEPEHYSALNNCTHCGAAIGTELLCGFNFPKPCECTGAKAQRDKEEADRLERESQRRQKEKHRQYVQRVEASGIPARFRGWTLGDYDPAGNEGPIQVAAAYINSFPENAKSGRSLYLIGDVGRGKTRLATTIALHVMQQGYTAKYVSCAAIYDQLKAGFGSSDGLLDSMTETGLLILDDVGKERVTEWTESVLFRIVNERYEKCRPIIITSNLGIDNIKARYTWSGDAIVSRIFEICRAILLSGPDRRMA